MAQKVKSLPAVQETWVGKIPWRREWLLIPVFLPGEFHGQRSLAGYSPWVYKELDITEQLHFHFLSSSTFDPVSTPHTIHENQVLNGEHLNVKSETLITSR